MLKGCRVHAKINCLPRQFYSKWHHVFFSPAQSPAIQYFYLLCECSAAMTAEVRKEMASRTWEKSHKVKGVKWGKVLQSTGGDVNCWTFEMFTLGNLNHIVKAITPAFVSHLIYWKLYAISCSSGPALHSGCSSTLSWLRATTARHPHHKNSSNHPKWGTNAQKHWSWPKNSMWTPESILKAIPVSKGDVLTHRVLLGWRLGVGVWVFLSLCREWAEHISVCSIPDSFQRCLLGSGHLLGVLLQGQGHGGAPSASKDMWTMTRWPRNEAGFDVSRGNCAYRELEGCFMQDKCCQTQSCFTDLVTFPTTWFHLLLFFKHWLILPLYLEISLVFDI